MNEAFIIDVVTLSPQAVVGGLRGGLVERAVQSGRVRLRVWNLREFSHDPHRKVDDVPFGGGRGMVLMVEPLVRAAEHAIESRRAQPGAEGATAAGQARAAVLVMSASGEAFTQAMARELSRGPGMVILCGRYEGIDARVTPLVQGREVSVGEAVLSGGEPAALYVMDAVVRLLPGVVGDPVSVVEESFGPEASLTAGLLEYPQYTRPRVYRGLAVPEVLLSGNHQAVARWRREQALRRTLERRPQLLARAPLSPEEREQVERWRREQGELSGPGGAW